jgi:hypothetical protein
MSPLIKGGLFFYTLYEQTFGPSPATEKLGQGVNRLITAQLTSYVQRQTLSGELIDNCKYSVWPTVMSSVMHDVTAPYMVLPNWPPAS